MTITWNEVKDLLMAESTNASRTYNVDGVSHFEDIVIDDQAADSLRPLWREATSKLSEKMHDFASITLSDTQAVYAFDGREPVGAESNAKMYVVNYMMAYWLANVRPDYPKQYLDRANFEMDDLLRKLYKKEAPV
jgi:hypothetical protein